MDFLFNSKIMSYLCIVQLSECYEYNDLNKGDYSLFFGLDSMFYGVNCAFLDVKCTIHVVK